MKEISDSNINKDFDTACVINQIVLSHSGRCVFHNVFRLARVAGSLARDLQLQTFQRSPARVLRMLFAGTELGTIRSYKFPLTGDFSEIQVHSAPVTRLRITYDDAFLFSVSEDATVYIFDVRDKEGRADYCTHEP